ncbi:hypothetical protein ACFXOG_34075, partial [Streptomyces sp. NPDC059168]
GGTRTPALPQWCPGTGVGVAGRLAATGPGDAVRCPWCGTRVRGRGGDGTGDGAFVAGTDGTGVGVRGSVGSDGVAVGVRGTDGVGVGAAVGGPDGAGTGTAVGGRLGEGTGDAVAWPPEGTGVAVAPEREAGRAAP